MPESLIGWLVLGLLAGWLSGAVVPDRQARGCLADILVGVLGALVGGFIARELGFGDPNGFLGALVVALVGAVIVRLAIGAISGPRR